MQRARLPLAAIIGAPVTLLLIGGVAGWFMRGDASPNPAGNAPAATVMGGTLPADLSQYAPLRQLAAPPNPAVNDPGSIIGFQPAGTIEVPPTAALDLPLTAGGSAEVVDPVTHLPADAAPPAARTIAGSTAIDSLPTLAPPQSTLPPAVDAPLDGGTPTTGPDAPLFTDPCVTQATPCAGLPGVVRSAAASDEPAALAPLQISFPLAGAAGFAAQCDSIEAGNVPDTLLTPATRPTVAVLVNQPSTLALTGQWADGAALDKVTLVTSPADDAEWKRSWDQDRLQRNIVACLTLPLGDVRAHAAAGIGELRANVLAISATGRAEITGQVTLNIPTDGDNDFFADRLVIADRGEQRRNDVLYPTVHVHYAFLTDTVAPSGSGLDPASTRVYGQHAFVQGADCAGWAANQQGRDRTSSALFTVTSEERNIAGRPRNVTIVDGDVYLDPTMPAGWEGQLCVRLIASDQPAGAAVAGAPKPLTLALRGATVRGPRTADYSVSVVLDGSTVPADSRVQATWTTPTGETLCTEAVLTTPAELGATCTSSARFALDGVQVALSAIDTAGTVRPLVAAMVPINTAYCNPDDPFGASADGCSRGFTQSLEVPMVADNTIRVVLNIGRTAGAGMLRQDPSHAWLVGPVTSFTS